MKKSCTILLQRNLPEVTNKFADNLLKYNSELTDFYVVESGSDDDMLTSHKTFHANWEDARVNGLRTGRGFNYALKELQSRGLDYEYVMMATGDAEIAEEPVIDILIKEFEEHPRLGILSPITWNWGERVAKFKNEKVTKAMSIPIPHICWMFRRECIEDLVDGREPSIYEEFLYDGTNFRCYAVDTELKMRAYAKNWAFGITSKTSHKEDYDLTDQNYVAMKTDSHNKHRELMWKEGLEWMKKKYGFNDKYGLMNLLRKEYDGFFNRNPDALRLKY